MSYVVEVVNLTYSYPDGTQVSIGELPFTISSGERVALLGGNGSGKSTLLNHVTGLLAPQKGTVEVLGVEPRKNLKKIAFALGIVLQSPEEQLLGPTVWDEIAFAPRNKGWSEGQIAQELGRVVTELNIENLMAKIPHYLSGGEQQKVALAGALIMRPQLLVLDEPFSKLDNKSRMCLIKLLNEINIKYGTAILYTMHDISCLAQLADTVYLMHQGRLEAKGKPQELMLDKELLERVGLTPPPLVELAEELKVLGMTLPETLDPQKLVRAIIDQKMRACVGRKKYGRKYGRKYGAVRPGGGVATDRFEAYSR